MDIESFYTKIGYGSEDLPKLVERIAVLKKADGSIVCGN